MTTVMHTAVFAALAAAAITPGTAGQPFVQRPVSASPAAAAAPPAAAAAAAATPGCGRGCGNVGDPYEGSPRPPSQHVIAACDTHIDKSGSYILTQDIGGDPAALCLQFYYPNGPVSLDLGGHTITGLVSVQGNVAGSYYLLNGAILCHAAGGACLTWGVPEGRMHHLTVENNAPSALANVTITATTSSANTVPRLEIDHLTSTVVASPADTHRTRNIMDDGANGGNPAVISIPIEFKDNLITCGDGASACQGVALWDAPYAYIHNNKIVLPESPDGIDPAQGVLFDEKSDYGVLADNEFIVNADNHAVRIRNSHHIAVQENLFENVGARNHGRTAAIQIGGANAGIDDAFVNISGNHFELGPGGNGIVSAAAADVYAHDNTVACLAPECKGVEYFARTDVPDTVAGDQSGGNITLANNDVAALTAAGLPAVHACGITKTTAFDCSGTLTAITTATVCDSGAADGYGRIVRTQPPCPPPASPSPLPRSYAGTRPMLGSSQSDK